jgi:hypothetical protein
MGVSKSMVPSLKPYFPDWDFFKKPLILKPPFKESLFEYRHQDIKNPHGS